MSYTIVELEQGTCEWLDWRNGGLGASDAPAIMGESPWKKPDKLLQEKLIDRRCPPNAAMARGTALEPVARKRYQEMTGHSVAPACLQSSRLNWLRASVDGISPDGDKVIEIKCGESVYRHSSTTGKVPGYYYGQLQHILAVTGLSEIDYFCFLPGLPEVHLPIPRNDEYIGRLLETEAAFWEKLTALRRDSVR